MLVNNNNKENCQSDLSSYIEYVFPASFPLPTSRLRYPPPHGASLGSSLRPARVTIQSFHFAIDLVE